MSKKYIGDYFFTTIIENGEEISILMNVDDESDWYPNEFMRTDKDSEYDGIMTETNSSAIALKLSRDGELAELWRIW
jgi:hypothetical protein